MPLYLKWVLGAAVLFLAWNAIRRTYLAWASRSWPSVPGHITTSEIVAGRNSSATRNYRLALKYAYSVAGEAYNGSVISFGIPFALPYAAQKLESLQRSFSVGKEVPVFYHPRKPSLCVLRPGPDRSLVVLYLVIFIPAFGLFVGLFPAR